MMTMTIRPVGLLIAQGSSRRLFIQSTTKFRQGVERARTVSEDAASRTTAQQSTKPATSHRTEKLNLLQDAGEKQPCGCKKNGRNLVVCIDGTSNQFGTKNSNVVEFYSLIRKRDGKKQRTWYNSGIGTYAKHSRSWWRTIPLWLHHIPDMMFAWNSARIVCGAYLWLSDNYESGDRIFLLGFSRGAYQARVISAMIEKVGLIHKGNEMQIPFAYELYSREPERTELCKNFKKTFSRNDVKVHFVGAWDTVSSVGIFRARELLPGTTDGMQHVCYFRHALALDERRVKFLPDYAYGGLMKPKASSTQESPTPPPPTQTTQLPSSSEAPLSQESLTPRTSSTHFTPATPTEPKRTSMWQWLQDLLEGPMTRQTPLVQEPLIHPLSPSHPKTKTTEKSKWKTDVKEVWFAGTHSDIGGGNRENTKLSRKVPPLRWMVSQARKAGLDMDVMHNEFKPLEKLKVIESLTWLWWPLEILPLKFRDYTDGFSTTRRPHFGSGRTICDGQKIDLSVCLTPKSWVPKARAPCFAELDPKKLRDEIDGLLSGPQENYPDFLEVDQYERARIMLLRRMERTEDGGLQNQMHSESKSDPQWQKTLLKALIEILSEPGSNELDRRILEAFNTELFPLSIRRRQADLGTASALIQKLLYKGTEKDKDTARKFLSGFTVPIIQTAKTVACAVFSKGGQYIFYDGCDPYLRVSDVYTGEVVAQALTMGDIYAIAFSSNGGRCVVGGKRLDGKGFVQVFNWHEEHPQLVEVQRIILERPLERHSVGFLPNVDPDQEEDVVALEGKDISVWNVSTGKASVQLKADTGHLNHLALSPRGDAMTAYSRLCGEFRVWDTATRECLRTRPVRAYDQVLCMAYSSDGELLAAGYGDGSIRIWDIKSGMEAGQMAGHNDGVQSVCFSSDSRFLVSGSNDLTVKVWNLQTYKLLKTFDGHEDFVMSVAFSPDGKHIVSGSDDRSVRVWDIEKITSSSGGPIDA